MASAEFSGIGREAGPGARQPQGEGNLQIARAADRMPATPSPIRHPTRWPLAGYSLTCYNPINTGIWVWMKTTIELPEALFRRAKSMAAQEGVTLKQLLTEALESQLDMRSRARNGKTAPKWMRAYGALRHLRHERKAIERAIESEFEKIEPEDRL